VTVHTNAQTTEITGDGGKVNGLAFKHRGDGTDARVELEGVFVQIGLVPNTEWLGARSSAASSARSKSTPRRHQRARRVCRRRLHHRALQADRGRGRRRLHAALSAFDYLIRTPAPKAASAGAPEAVAA
jgi:alkyl hydroperoxide reductase subunit F